MAIQIQLRRDTATQWTALNPTLAQGELAVEIDTLKFKIGDGTTVWASLGYFTQGAQGSQGSVWYSGAGVPGAGLGVLGDWYLDTTSAAYYEKTGTSTWTQRGTLGQDHGSLGGLADDDHPQYIKHSLAEAISDFLVASGAGVFVKKTLAEVKTVLGLGALAYKSTVTTDDLDNDAVTYAKLQNVSATDRVLGRVTAGAGNAEEIACTAAGRAILDDANATDQRATLGLGGAATKEATDFVQVTGDQEMAGSLRITAATKDFFGGGIGAELGLIQRVVNMGIAPDTHFVSTSPTPGYAWAPTSGIFYGAPNNATFGYRGDYFAGAPNGASQAHFFQRAVTNAAANWQNKSLMARCSAGGSMIAGLRVDDGSDLSTHPFFELICDGTATDGTFIVKMRYQNTVGGGITTTASQVRLPVTFFQTLSLNIWYSGGQYYISGYLWGEVKNNFGIGLNIGPVSWMPCAGRAGIFLKADAAGSALNGYWDFLYNEFV